MNEKRKILIDKLQKTRTEFWNIRPDSAKVVTELMKKEQPQKILEIGASNGLSAIIIGNAIESYGGKLTTIEYYEERAHLARKHIEEAGLEDTVKVITGDALAVIPTLSDKWDFVFLDAGKQDYIKFYHLLLPKLSPESIFVADNTVSHRKQTSDFIEAITNDKRFDVEEFGVGDGLLIAKYHQ